MRSAASRKTETIGGATDDLRLRLRPGRAPDAVTSRTARPSARYTYDANGNRLSAPAQRHGQRDLRRPGPPDSVRQHDLHLHRQRRAAEQDRRRADHQLPTTTGSATCSASRCPDGTRSSTSIDGQNRRIGKRVNGALVQGFLYQDSCGRSPSWTAAATSSAASSTPRAQRAGLHGQGRRDLPHHHRPPRQPAAGGRVATGTVAQRMDYDEFGTSSSTPTPASSRSASPAGSTTATPSSCASARATTTRRPDGGRRRIQWFDGEDTNLYGYVLNDPVNFIDFSRITEAISRFS